MRNLPTYEGFINEAYAYDIKRGLKHIKFLLSNPLMYKTPFYIAFKKGTDEKEVETLVKSAESDSKDVAKMPRSYGKGPYGEITLELEKPNYPGLTWIFKALDEFYGNNGSSMGWFGDIEESQIEEKIVYPEGTKTTGNKILDKLAKLLHQPSCTIEITTNQVRAVNGSFAHSSPSTFFVNKREANDYYFLMTNKGTFRVEEKDVKKAEDLFDELESIIQAGKTKRAIECDMFGKV